MDDFYPRARDTAVSLIIDELYDMGVSPHLIYHASRGGRTLIRALYLFVMEEAAHA